MGGPSEQHGNHILASDQLAQQTCGLCSGPTIDSCGWVVFDTQVNVFIDTKAKVASLAEVPPEELILLHFQTALLQPCSSALSRQATH